MCAQLFFFLRIALGCKHLVHFVYQTSGQRILMTGHIAGGIFHWEHLVWQSTACAAGQLECWSTACGEIIGHWERCLMACGKIPTSSPSTLPLCMRIWTPSSTSFLGPTKVSVHNGIVIGLATFAGLTVVTDRQINRPYCFASSSRVPLASAVMRPNNTLKWRSDFTYLMCCCISLWNLWSYRL